MSERPFTAAEVHDQMASCVRLFARTSAAGDLQAAQHWLNLYHTCWDQLEELGVGMEVNLPEVPDFFNREPDAYSEPAWKRGKALGLDLLDWPATPIQWGATFEEPRGDNFGPVFRNIWFALWVSQHPAKERHL